VDEGGRAEQPEWVVLGRIVRAQGLNGAVRVMPCGIAPEVSEALVGKQVFLRPPRPADAPREAVLQHERWHKATWIIELADCSTRTEAESLVGWEVCLAVEDRAQLGPDEFYPDQLIGLDVVDAHTGETLGRVAAIQPSAPADLLEVVRPDGGRFLIPMVHALIKEVHLALRTIRVDLPQGLTEISVG